MDFESILGRGLRSRARYQTRRDRTRLETIPEWPGPGRDYFFMVPLLGKIQEKFGKNSGRDGMGLLGTTREKWWKFFNCLPVFLNVQTLLRG